MTISTVDTSTFVGDTWEAFSWRMMSNYVSPWERERLHERIAEWSDWCSTWSQAAAEHAARGDEAAAAGNDHFQPFQITRNAIMAVTTMVPVTAIPYADASALDERNRPTSNST